jgi:hypothetical protein
MKVTGPYLGRPDGRWWNGAVEPSSQPIQRCMAERPEASRGHSIMKGNVSEIVGVGMEREGPNKGSLRNERKVG